jgi:hypothetical protein
MDDDELYEEIFYDILNPDPYCCKRCQSEACDCHGKCCSFCRGYELELIMRSLEEEIGREEK